MFPSHSLLAIPRDQFTAYTSPFTRRRLRWGQAWLLAPGAIVAVLMWWLHPSVTEVASGLLTAVSIMTGLAFTMAITFWNKTIEARRDPSWATDSASLQAIDHARNHMIWTVTVGIVAVAVLALFSLFRDVTPPVPLAVATSTLNRLLGALVGFLVIYMVTLVGAALRVFNQIATILKA